MPPAVAVFIAAGHCWHRTQNNAASGARRRNEYCADEMLFLGMLGDLVHAGETSAVLMRCYFWECSVIWCTQEKRVLC